MDTGSMTAAAITNSSLAFIAFMPRPSSVATGDVHELYRVDLVAANAVSLGLGFTLTLLTRSHAPIIAALVASISLTVGYEYLAREGRDLVTRKVTENVRF